MTINIETQLEHIERELDLLEKRKNALLIQKSDLLKSVQPVSANEQFCAKQRIAIFRDLFTGRDDVFAIRWENNNTGKSGYSPACHNEWQKGICDKPRTKCTECPHQDFKAFDANQVYKHLTGKQTIGSYVLSKGGACRFLAIDFDKSDWKAAVKSSVQAAKIIDVPFAVEISRSGQGAHFWVFFGENVPAKLARKLGCILLDKAMDICPTLSFDSYDRMFPHQESLPEGGFGNLIALPLQLDCRKSGFTEFVDENLQPIADQWKALKDVVRMSHLEVVRKVSKYTPEQSCDAPPGERVTFTNVEIIADCPASVKIIRANRLFVPTYNLPAKLFSQIKKIASFSNPEFFKKQALRFSTHGTPRFISLARVEGEYLSIPRGCENDLLELFTFQQIDVSVEQQTSSGSRLSKLNLTAKLRKEQTTAVEQMVKHDIGILHAPTAFGKTVTAIGIIAKRNVNTLVLTHNKQLVEQWQERIKAFTQGIECGIHTGSKKSLTGQIDVATYQSLINKKDNTVSTIVNDYGQIVIDECHHIPAPSFEMVLSQSSAKYILGLTATPNRQDGLQKIMLMLAGSVRHKVQDDRSKTFTQKVFVKHLHYQFPQDDGDKGTRIHISEFYKWLAQNSERNQIIIEDVIGAAKEGRYCLLLSERRAHTVLLHEMLLSSGIRCALLTGAMNAKERDATKRDIQEAQVVIATGKYVGEGFDLPKLDTLFITLPISWKGTLAQYAGRIHRTFNDKKEVRIMDYVEVNVATLKRMFLKREKGYLAMGYQVHNQ